MRAILSLVVLALLAGCVTPPAATDAPTNGTAPTTGMAPLPEPIDATETVTGSGDPVNLLGMPPCSSPSAKCFRYPFTLDTNATLTADLSWGAPASDFDMYLEQAGAQVLSGASDVTAGPGTAEHMEGDLIPGDYEIVVVAWSVAQDTFTLHAEFSGNATASA